MAYFIYKYMLNKNILFDLDLTRLNRFLSYEG